MPSICNSLTPDEEEGLEKTPASAGVILFQTVKEEIKQPLFAERIIGGVEIAKPVVPTREKKVKGFKFQCSKGTLR